jgi:hypothetical protein
MPYITADVVQEFVRGAAALNADLVYPVVPVSLCLERFPGLRRTSVPVREGRLTGGNMVLVSREFMEAQRERILAAYAARKSPLRLALMLGLTPTVLVGASVASRRGCIGIPRLERAASRLVGGVARALLMERPEIATDVDRLSDIEALRSARPL